MATAEANSWEETLRKMLPPGAPLPNEEQLDYSIAIEYDGPPIPYSIPKIEPLESESISLRSSSLGFSALPKGSRFDRHRSGGSRGSPMESARSSSVVRGSAESDGGDNTSRSSPRASSIHDPNSLSGSPRRPMVTFKDEEEDLAGESPAVASPVDPARERERERKRGVCSRCGKGNILKEREACLVCDARYCSNCVLKAMGSMPEGRKCVTCIGHPINEAKRSGLGKCSRMLCRVCSPLEVQQIMKAERECPANQLRPEQLVVNGRALSQEELDEVLGCSNPPQKLRPGKYWYDKDSGLWGKVKEIFLPVLSYFNV